ncbi:MAG: alpha-amylase family glycosyl hydrolase [Prevotella sp.]|nr:alpha-amylase family glycosyl hydrolase [Prevotella sp.]MCM1475935.1 alpha-amylase family glycosyl hydrolase [Muribaculaceae bacterium]
MKKILLSLTFGGLTMSALGQCWPAQYEGVMLQGFFWDSYSGTNNSKWATLTNQSDELSQYFKAIWVPNSAKAASNPSMGYDPVYWFTNHNSSFGTEAQLRTMIKTFNDKGTDIIEDVVVNHRSGVSNWTNFPTETWNGKTYKMGPAQICSNDEVAYQSGQATPTGARDTGENFDGSRDLDHTSSVVQDCVKDYCKFLLTDIGYAGFRWDMVKGFGGQYVEKYLQSSKPKYSVGEYWDGNYDRVAAWIEATGRQSAAFDFPLKYAMNEAFTSNDMSKLVWMANGSTPQPAGMIHYNYPRLAVTFVDNHDTYRDGSKFTGNVLAANAFILCSPGTPCVFLPHWNQYKSQIKKMIEVRNAVGLHNESAVKVLRHDRDCYLAEVTGKKGKLVVKIGSAQVTPDGYSNSDIKALGNGYCIWTKVGGIQGGGDDPIVEDYPKMLYLIGNQPQGSWNTAKAVPADEASKGVYKWNSAELVESAAGANAYFSFTSILGNSASDWTTVNGSHRYGATSLDEQVKVNGMASIQRFDGGANAGDCYAWQTTPGTYSFIVDLTKNKFTLSMPSGVEMIESDSEHPAIYYNLQGVRVEHPESGIYIKVQGEKRNKVIIR